MWKYSLKKKNYVVSYTFSCENFIVIKLLQDSDFHSFFCFLFYFWVFGRGEGGRWLNIESQLFELAVIMDGNFSPDQPCPTNKRVGDGFKL